MKKLFSVLMLFALAMTASVTANAQKQDAKRASAEYSVLQNPMAGQTMKQLIQVNGGQAVAMNLPKTDDSEWSEWEPFAPQGSNVAKWIFGAWQTGTLDGMNVMVRTSLSNSEKKQLKVTNWGAGFFTQNGVEILIDWNTRTNNCRIPVQTTGVLNTYYNEDIVFGDVASILGEQYASSYPSTYDPVLGRFSFYLLYSIPSIIYNGQRFDDGYEYLQMPGYKDYTFQMGLGSFVENVEARTASQEIVIKAHGNDVAGYRYAIVKAEGNPNFKELLEASETVSATSFTFDNIAPGAYYVAAGTVNEDGELTTNIADDVVYFSSSTAWNSLGMKKYTDDLIAGYYDIDNVTYEVEVQESKSNPGLFRVKNMFGEAFPYNEEGNWREDVYVYFNATDPDNVQPYPTTYPSLGLDWGDGELQWGLIGEVGGTYDGSCITFPTRGIGCFDPSGQGYYANRNGLFKLMIHDNKIDVVEGLVKEEGESETIVFDVKKGSELNSAKYMVFKGDFDQNDYAALANEALANGADVADGAMEVVLGESGKYVVIFAGATDGKIADIKAFNYDFVSATGWKNIGEATFTDNIVLPIFEEQPVSYKVAVQQHAVRKGLFRLVKPYLANPQSSVYTVSEETATDLVINAEDPQGVVIERQSLGLTFQKYMRNYKNMARIASQAAVIRDANEETYADIKAAQPELFGKFENGTITLPAKSLFIYLNATEATKEVVEGEVVISGIVVPGISVAAPAEANAGSEFEIAVELKGEGLTQAQFDVFMPEGVEVVGAKSEVSSHAATFNKVSNGAVRVVLSSMENAELAAGKVASIIAKAAAEGEYNGTISNIVLAYANGSAFEADEVAFAMNIANNWTEEPNVAGNIFDEDSYNFNNGMGVWAMSQWNNNGGNAKASIVTPGYEGSKGALMLSNTSVADQNYAAQFCGKVSVLAPGVYTLTFFAKAGKNGSKIEFGGQIQPWAQENPELTGINFELTNEWKQYTKEFELTFEGLNTFYFNFGKTVDDICIDRIAIVKAPTKEPNVKGNLLDEDSYNFNNGLGKWAMSQWNNNGGKATASVVAPGYDGSKGALKLSNTAEAGQNYEAQFCIALDNAAKKGTYEVKFFAKADKNGSKLEMGGQIQPWAQENPELNVGTFELTNSWKQYSKQFDLNFEGLNAFYFNFGKTVDNLYVDRISIVLIKEDLVEEIMLNNEIDWENSVIYNIKGQRVSAPVKGNMYIVNGKKLLY